MNTKHIKKDKLKKVANLIIVAFWGGILIQILYMLKSLKNVRRLFTMLKMMKIVN